MPDAAATPPNYREDAKFSGSFQPFAIHFAFVTETGLEILERRVLSALRAATTHIRFVTGDFLAFTQVDALRQLVGWAQIHPETSGEEPCGWRRRRRSAGWQP